MPELVALRCAAVVEAAAPEDVTIAQVADQLGCSTRAVFSAMRRHNAAVGGPTK
jgi:hypothetical protein